MVLLLSLEAAQVVIVDEKKHPAFASKRRPDKA
jgi:hypothetical protein